MTTHAALAWSRLLQSRRARIGLSLLGLIALFGLFAELVAARAPIVAFGPGGPLVLPAVTSAERFDRMTDAELAARFAADTVLWPPVRFGPTTVSEAGPSAPPSGAHPFGTDLRGRDLLARVVYGARTAFGLAVVAVALAAALGIAMGGLAGYYRGFWNDRLVRLIETVDTFPAVVVVALVRAVEREPSALSLVVAVAIVRWAEIARLVRAEVLHISAEDYVTAARALGASPSRIFFRHVFPNAAGPVLVSSVFGLASVALLEAAISFLEMGAPTAVASWGETLAEAARRPDETRLLVPAGLALAAMIGGAYLLADALRDALDPRTVRRRPDAPQDSPLSVYRDA